MWIQAIFSETTQERLTELESRKKALGEAIETEKTKRQLTQDEYSIQRYFDEFADADLENPETREMLLDYFVDKIYVYGDHIKLTGWFSYDRQRIVTWQDLNSVTVEFNAFALGSTKKRRLALASRLFLVEMRRKAPQKIQNAGSGVPSPPRPTPCESR